MLKCTEFIDIDKGKENVLNTIKSQIQKQEGSFMIQIKMKILERCGI